MITEPRLATACTKLEYYMKITENKLASVMPKSKQICVDGIDIKYYDEGEGEVVLLLHGWPQTAYVWRKIFPVLTDTFRVIALDLPGTGGSGPAKAYDTRSIAKIINDFIDQLHLGKIHLVGRDVGAWVSVSFALHFGSQLKTLSILDAGIPGLMPKDTFKPENAAKIWQFYFHGINEMPEFLIKGKEKEYLSWYFKNKSHRKEAISEDDLNYYAEEFIKNNGFGYYRGFSESAKQNLTVREKIEVPILAIGAEFAIGDGIGIAMKKVADDVEAVILKDSGHYVPEEQPEVLLEFLMKHLKKIAEK